MKTRTAAWVIAGVTTAAVAGALGLATERFPIADAPGAQQAPADPGAHFATAPPDEHLLHSRLTYPTGYFNPAWLLESLQQDRLIESALPAGRSTLAADAAAASGLSPDGFVPLGPRPLNNTQMNFGHVGGRVNAIAVDPRTTTDGSIVAYIATDGGGVWKTTNCCNAGTAWSPVTDIPQVNSIAIGDIAFDPSNPDVIYAGTGDLRFGSYSFGSSGILKSVDQGNTWRVLGADVFTPHYTPTTVPPSGQYQSVSKVVVDPNDPNRVVAGTKTGVYFSYDAGESWSGPCYTNPHSGGVSPQRQDITGLLAVNRGGSTMLYAAVGTRGLPTPVQPDLANNGANGVYRAAMPASGCPAVADWTLLNNGWPAGTGNGTPSTRGRIELAVAPTDPLVLYAEVADSTARNVQRVYKTIDGGNTWTPRAAAAQVAGCGDSTSAGGGAQMWYDARLLVYPDNADRVLLSGFDLYRSTNGGGNFSNITCGWTTKPAGTLDHVHVDHHATAFVGNDPNRLLVGSDGGVFFTANALATFPSFRQLNDTLNTIEIYSGDITGNFATAATRGAAGGFQDNGSAVVTYAGPAGPALWEEVGAGDGMFSRIEPVLGLNWYFSIYYGQIWQSVVGPDGDTNGANYWPDQGAWGTPLVGASSPHCDNTTDPVNKERKSFLMPFDIYRYGDTLKPGSGCDAASGCTHLIAGTCRVWETTTGHFANSVPVTGDVTKGTLVYGTDNRSYINQIHYSFSDASVAIAGTSDGNVQYIYRLGTGAPAATVNVTGNNTVLPNRQVLNVATDPQNPWIGYAAMGGFDQNTPATPGHVFRVTCTPGPAPLGGPCDAFVWQDKTGNLPNIPVGAILPNPRNPRQVFAGTDWGLYFTNDITTASPTWYRFDGMPHVMIWDMVIDRGYTTLALFTRSRGAWVYPLPAGDVTLPASVATLVADPADGTAPLTVTLDASGSTAPPGSAITSYQFDFGDGTALPPAQADATITHVYEQVGTFQPTVRVVDSRGMASELATATVTVTSAEDATPDPFTFVERTNVNTSVFVTSEAKTITGINVSVPVSIANGQYSIDGGAFTTAAGTIASGQTLRVRHVSGSTPGATVTTSVTVGTYTATFKSTTSSADRTPDAFVFQTQTGVQTSTEIPSDVITPSGYTVPVSVQAGPGSMYRINGGEWTADTGTINPGETLQTKHTSAGTSLTYTKTYVKVGGVTGYFTTRTK